MIAKKKESSIFFFLLGSLLISLFQYYQPHTFLRLYLPPQQKIGHPGFSVKNRVYIFI